MYFQDKWMQVTVQSNQATEDLVQSSEERKKKSNEFSG